MKTRITILLTVLAGVAVALPLIAFSAIKPAATNIDNPEFYFTRLVYRENGARSRGGLFGFGRGTMPKPAPYHCPEFGGATSFLHKVGVGPPTIQAPTVNSWEASIV